MNKKSSVNEKHLLVGLFCLLVIIVGLVMAIVVVNKNQDDNEPTEELVDETDELACYYDDEEEEEGTCEDDIELNRSESEMVKAVEKIEKEEQAMADRGSVDVGKINHMYDDGIKKATELGRSDYVFVLVSARTDFLKENGLQKEALDALLKTDFDLFLDPDKYRLYSEIIEIADDLKETEISSRYRQLQKTVADEYWADYRGTEEAAKKYQEEQSINETEERNEINNEDE